MADRICNYNRHYAEYSTYWETTSFLQEESEGSGEITFYDSNTGARPRAQTTLTRWRLASARAVHRQAAVLRAAGPLVR